MTEKPKSAFDFDDGDYTGFEEALTKGGVASASCVLGPLKVVPGIVAVLHPQMVAWDRECVLRDAIVAQWFEHHPGRKLWCVGTEEHWEIFLAREPTSGVTSKSRYFGMYLGPKRFEYHGIS